MVFCAGRCGGRSFMRRPAGRIPAISGSPGTLGTTSSRRSAWAIIRNKRFVVCSQSNLKVAAYYVGSFAIKIKVKETKAQMDKYFYKFLWAIQNNTMEVVFNWLDGKEHRYFLTQCHLWSNILLKSNCSLSTTLSLWIYSTVQCTMHSVYSIWFKMSLKDTALHWKLFPVKLLFSDC